MCLQVLLISVFSVLGQVVTFSHVVGDLSRETVKPSVRYQHRELFAYVLREHGMINPIKAGHL